MYDYIKIDNTEIILFVAEHDENVAQKLINKTPLISRLYEMIYDYQKIPNKTSNLDKAVIIDHFIENISKEITEVFGIDIMNNCFNDSWRNSNDDVR